MVVVRIITFTSAAERLKAIVSLSLFYRLVISHIIPPKKIGAITSVSKRSLPHSFGIKKAVSTMATLKTTNQVIPFLPVESSTATSRASKPDGCISSCHPPPPLTKIITLTHEVSM